MSSKAIAAQRAREKKALRDQNKKIPDRLTTKFPAGSTVGVDVGRSQVEAGIKALREDGSEPSIPVEEEEMVDIEGLSSQDKEIPQGIPVEIPSENPSTQPSKKRKSVAVKERAKRAKPEVPETASGEDHEDDSENEAPGSARASKSPEGSGSRQSVLSSNRGANLKSFNKRRHPSDQAHINTLSTRDVMAEIADHQLKVCADAPSILRFFDS
jgi:hypothetical protein